jgi:heat shock protein HtpX
MLTIIRCALTLTRSSSWEPNQSYQASENIDSRREIRLRLGEDLDDKNMPNTIKTALLLGAMSALFLFLGDALGGSQGLVLGFLFAAATNLASYWFSDKIVLRLYRAQEVGPEHRLYQVVGRLAARAGLPMPRVYIIPQPSPNAFATGRNPDHAAVAATEGILRILNDAELEGVLAHELAHIKHRDILISSVAATLAAAIMMTSRFAMFWGATGRGDDREGGASNPLVLLATIILAPLAAMLIQMAISRSREYDADAGGAAIAGGPMGLVNALKKLEAASRAVPLDANPATAHMFIIKPLSISGLMSLFSTHPPTEARIQALLSHAR